MNKAIMGVFGVVVVLVGAAIAIAWGFNAANVKNETLADELILIPQGEYTALPFELQSEGSVEVSTKVLEGAALDILLLTEDMRDRYAQLVSNKVSGDAFLYLPFLTNLEVEELSDAAMLPPGKYFLVFDNSRLAGQAGSASVRAWIKLTVPAVPSTPPA